MFGMKNIGIPFLIRYGNKCLTGKTDTVMSCVDIMPTILSLMDLDIPETVEGTNLKTTLLEDVENDNKAFIACYPGQIPAIKEFEKVNEDNKRYGWRAVKTKTHTYVVNRGYRPNREVQRYLYDNINDEYQLNPLKLNDSSEDKLSNELENLLKEWAIKYKDKFKF